MKVAIKAGAEFDVMTAREMRHELDQVMASWFAEVSRGDRFRRFTSFGDADLAGAVTIGEGEQLIGPAEGFAWSVKRLAISGYDPAGAQSMALYLNSTETSSLVYPGAMPAYTNFDTNQLVLYPGDKLIVVGAGVSGRIWVTGQARELPVNLAWRL